MAPRPITEACATIDRLRGPLRLFVYGRQGVRIDGCVVFLCEANLNNSNLCFSSNECSGEKMQVLL